MNVSLAQRIYSAAWQARRACFAAAVACALPVALSSCDSQDPDLNTGTPVPRVTNAVDTETGEAVVLSQEELSAQFAQLSGLVAEAATADVWHRFRALQQASLAVSGNRLVVKVTGDNPVLLLPTFAAGQRFIIEAVIESPADTSAQMFYLTPGQTKYSEDQSQIVDLKAGHNVVYFKVDDPNVVDPLRFDPASTPGSYTIERMTARGLAPGMDD